MHQDLESEVNTVRLQVRRGTSLTWGLIHIGERPPEIRKAEYYVRYVFLTLLMPLKDRHGCDHLTNKETVTCRD